MVKIIRNGLYTIVGICLLWGVIVGIFTWDSSKIFPAYLNLIGLLISPVTNSIGNELNKAFEPKK
jgi:hypothetical protein